jgi:hypothetical protein
MFTEKVLLDLVNPINASLILFLEVLVVIIEAIIIYFLIEKGWGKAFVSSITANFITGILSLLYLLFSIDASASLYLKVILVIIIPLIINIVIEAGILRLFFSNVNKRKILKTSVVMNIASYVLIIVNMMPLLIP